MIKPLIKREWRADWVLAIGVAPLGFGFKLEKLPAVVKWTEIKILGMSFIVAIFEDSKSWALHGPK